MSFVIALPEVLMAAAGRLQAIGSAVSTANLTAVLPITSVIPAAADEVSMVTARSFAAYGQLYQAINTEAHLIHEQFVRALGLSANSYAATDAANATHAGGSSTTGTPAQPSVGPSPSSPAPAPAPTSPAPGLEPQPAPSPAPRVAPQRAPSPAPRPAPNLAPTRPSPAPRPSPTSPAPRPAPDVMPAHPTPIEPASTTPYRSEYGGYGGYGGYRHGAYGGYGAHHATHGGYGHHSGAYGRDSYAGAH